MVYFEDIKEPLVIELPPIPHQADSLLSDKECFELTGVGARDTGRRSRALRSNQLHDHPSEQNNTYPSPKLPDVSTHLVSCLASSERARLDQEVEQSTNNFTLRLLRSIWPAVYVIEY